MFLRQQKEQARSRRDPTQASLGIHNTGVTIYESREWHKSAHGGAGAPARPSGYLARDFAHARAANTLQSSRRGACPRIEQGVLREREPVRGPQACDMLARPWNAQPTS